MGGKVQEQMEAPPSVYFYLPKKDWPPVLPSGPDEYWNGFGHGKGLTSGIYAWTLQTCLHLKRAGIACELVAELPKNGIVFAHRRSLDAGFRPSGKQLLVCLKADYDWHPYAQIHVVLNPRESGIIWNSHYIPHWRQPGLIPRNPLRGDAFENIAYFGEIDNLAPELRDAKWSDRLKAMGLKWCVMPRERWHDFSEVDAIVAVRSFQHRGYLAKPATKLYNAWHAGVPALLGEEAAYQAERKSDLDYCRVSSVEMTLNCLAKLMADIKLRNAMVENGRARALETASELTVEKWKHLINQIVIPAYLKWSGEAAPRREMFLRYRLIASKIRSWKMTLRRLLKPA